MNGNLMKSDEVQALIELLGKALISREEAEKIVKTYYGLPVE